MNDYYFTFRSVTAAMQGRQLLQRGGITAAAVRTPMELRQQGCGYSLRLPERSYERARALLDRAGRLQLPREMLDALQLTGNRVRVEMENGRIVLTAPDEPGHENK